MKRAQSISILLLICTIIFNSCDDNPTESQENSIFVHRFVDTELFGNDIDAKITFITDTLIDEHGYYYTVQMPTVNILLIDSILRVVDELQFLVSNDNIIFELKGGYVSGNYIFRDRIIFSYTPRIAGYNKLYIKGVNYDSSKLFFDVCIKYK